MNLPSPEFRSILASDSSSPGFQTNIIPNPTQRVEQLRS